MASPVYSTQFISQQGVNGSSSTVTVPAGHTYIVKQVGAYGSSTIVAIDCFLVDGSSGAAVWHGKVDGGTNGWNGFYGAFVFEEGDSFHMNIEAAPADSADCFCSGYDLTN